MYGYVYLTTNLANGRMYIGQHKSEIFDTSYFGSGKILLQAIEKEGIENFTCEILETYETKEDLDAGEQYYIDKYDAVNSRDYYNLTPGGTNNSVKGVVYITNGTINKKVFPEELEYYFDKGFVLGGPKQSEKTKLKRANSNRGKKRSQETCDKISKALSGRKLSPEHRAKAGIARLGKPSYNKGLIQVCKDNKYIFISPAQLDEYLQLGYEKKGTPKCRPSYRKNRVVVNNGKRSIFVEPAYVDAYLSSGYLYGGKKRKWIK